MKGVMTTIVTISVGLSRVLEVTKTSTVELLRSSLGNNWEGEMT